MQFFKKSKPRVFCIGLNKTGTTSIKHFFKDHNLKVGNQVKAEYLVDDWYKREYKSLLNYCEKSNAFQDVPFSLPFTFIILDQYFPNSKFILTIRDNAEQWYNSLTSFHSKLWSNGIDLPTANQLKEATYRYKGYAYEVHNAMFNTPENDPYNKTTLVNYYNNHEQQVIEYFRSKPEKLIVINVSVKNDYFRLCKFLEKPATKKGFSWENKTTNV